MLTEKKNIFNYRNFDVPILPAECVHIVYVHLGTFTHTPDRPRVRLESSVIWEGGEGWKTVCKKNNSCASAVFFFFFLHTKLYLQTCMTSSSGTHTLVIEQTQGYFDLHGNSTNHIQHVEKHLCNKMASYSSRYISHC